MIATPELRWVERWLNYNPITGETFLHPSPVKILQQKWLDEAIPPTHQEGEWLDVPTEKES